MSLFKQKRLQTLQPLSLTQAGHIRFRHWVHLYHQRFPYQELAPVPMLAESLNQSEAIIHGRFDRQHKLWAGFTYLEFYGSSTLLAYLATHPQYEGQGLARELVDEALQKSLSAEQPYFWLEASPKLWRFYQKLGFKRLDIDYRIPEFYAQGTEKMGLFVSLHDSVRSVEKTVVDNFVSELLLSGYGLKPEDVRYQQQMQVIHSYPHSNIQLLF